MCALTYHTGPGSDLETMVRFKRSSGYWVLCRTLSAPSVFIYIFPRGARGAVVLCGGVRRVRCGHIQGRQRYRSLQHVLCRHVLPGDRANLCVNMSCMPHAFVLGAGQQQRFQLHLLQGVHGSEWSSVQHVHSGPLQGHEREHAMYAVRSRHLFHSRGCDSVPRLS